MAKKDNTGKYLIVIGIIFIIISGYLIFSGGDSFLSGTSNKQISCDVEIKNPFGIPILKNGDLKISNHNCITKSSSICALPFGLLSNEGDLFLIAGGKQTSSSVKVSESILPGDSTKTYIIKLCVADSVHSGELKLISENEVIDTTQVNF